MVCFIRYLEEGRFPGRWKTARLIPLKKGMKPKGFPSSYRPNCLFLEKGKLFKRVIAARLTAHLDKTNGLPSL